MINRETPKLTVDGIIFCEKKVVLIKRKNPPFQNFLAIPGGFVEIGETVEEALFREISEETNLKIKNWNFLNIYSNPDRDPRSHIISLTFWTEVSKEELKNIKAGDDAKSVFLIKNWEEKNLAFDHKKIISDATQKKKNA